MDWNDEDTSDESSDEDDYIERRPTRPTRLNRIIQRHMEQWNIMMQEAGIFPGDARHNIQFDNTINHMIRMYFMMTPSHDNFNP